MLGYYLQRWYMLQFILFGTRLPSQGTAATAFYLAGVDGSRMVMYGVILTVGTCFAPLYRHHA